MDFKVLKIKNHLKEYTFENSKWMKEKFRVAWEFNRGTEFRVGNQGKVAVIQA